MKNNATTRFSNRVADYVKFRPSYPNALLDFMFSELGLSEQSIIADVGAGTGIFSKLLLERGAAVQAVEPNTEMRTAAEEALGGFEKFRSVAGSAEQTGLPSHSVDMVCAATAFHWFNAAPTKVEWERILRPVGLAFLVWNVRREATPFLSDYEKLLLRFGTNYSEAKNKNTEDNSGIDGFFAPHRPRARTFPNEQILDFESLAGRLLSSSYSPREGHPDHAPMMDGLRKIFEKHQIDGKIRFEYDTKAYWGPLR